MKGYIFMLMVALFVACAPKAKKQTQETTAEQYDADWESLKKHKTPEWFLNAKLGIYCHWGPYAVPAYKTEWYSHHMYDAGTDIRKHHEETYGTLDKFGYKDFIPMFKAEKFDPDAWASLFKKAGAQFAGPVTEHADGFAMWDSELTEWDVMDKGPKRDIVGELAASIRKQDMKFIATFHRHWLFAWYPTWDKTTDASDPKYAGLYGPYVPKGGFEMAVKNPKHKPEKPFNDDWLARLKEIVDKYEPDLVWFDNKMDIISEEHRIEFLQYYYNEAAKRNQEVVCTYKFEDMAKGSAVLDLERSRMKDKMPFPWLTDDSIDWGAWCDVADPDYKSTDRLIDFLVDVVSKNGAVLLNITPRADGSIPEGVESRLLEMGDWLNKNGESVYDTRPWKIYGEGPAEVVEGHLSERQNGDNIAEDIRFTCKGDKTLYATTLAWPGEKLVIKSLGKTKGHLTQKIKSITALVNNQPVKWTLNDENLTIDMSKQEGNYAYAFKIELF